MSSQIVPGRRWHNELQCNELHNVTYCVLVDYYSNFVEVDRLASMSTAHVVKALSTQFTRYGISEVLISDNGPCYASAEFKAFTERLDIEHRTSSPGYPQSNGKAENAVRTVKRLFKKAIESGESPEWALLTWRNVPMEGVGVSPSQIMFGRPSRTFLPRVRSTLTPSSPKSVQSALQSRKAKQARLYNRGTRSLRPLVSGQSIRMQLPGQSRWSVGVCVKPLSHRSYLVRVNGAHYRRNRRQLLATDEASPGDDLMAPGPSDFRPPQMPRSMPRSSAPPILLASLLSNSSPPLLQSRWLFLLVLGPVLHLTCPSLLLSVSRFRAPRHVPTHRLRPWPSRHRAVRAVPPVSLVLRRTCLTL